jgi:hypothetical protein
MTRGELITDQELKEAVEGYNRLWGDTPTRHLIFAGSRVWARERTRSSRFMSGNGPPRPIKNGNPFLLGNEMPVLYSIDVKRCSDCSRIFFPDREGFRRTDGDFCSTLCCMTLDNCMANCMTLWDHLRES